MADASLEDDVVPVGPALHEDTDALTMADRLNLVEQNLRRGIPADVTAKMYNFPVPQDFGQELAAELPGPDVPSALDLLPGAVRQTGSDIVRGVGALIDGTPETDSLIEEIGEEIGPNAIQEQRIQDRSEERERRREEDLAAAGDSRVAQGVANARAVGGKVADAVVQSAPQLGVGISSGLAARELMKRKGFDLLTRALPGPVGRLVRKNKDALLNTATTLGAAAPNFALYVASGVDRAAQEGLDLSDPETMETIKGQAFIRSAVETIVPMRILRKYGGDARVRRSLLRASAGSLTTAGVEGMTELADMAIEEIAFDPGLWNALTEEDRAALLPYAKERYGVEDPLVAFLAGGTIGGAADLPGAISQQKRTNAALMEDARKLSEIVEPLGVGGAEVDALTKTEKGVEKLRRVASEIGRVERARAAQTREIDALGNPELASALKAEMNAGLDERVDALAKELGATKTLADLRKEQDEVRRMRSDAARERLKAIGETAKEDVAPEVIEAQTSGLEKARARVERSRDRLEAVSDPDRREAIQKELTSAEEALLKARIEARQKLKGLTYDEAVADVKGIEAAEQRDKRRQAQAEKREQAIQRQVDLEMPETMAPEERAARAREILAEAEEDAHANRGLEKKIARLQRQRRAATGPEDIDRLSNEIADLEARKGLPTPAVEAARRVLQAQGEDLSPAGETQRSAGVEPVGAGIEDDVGNVSPVGDGVGESARPAGETPTATADADRVRLRTAVKERYGGATRPVVDLLRTRGIDPEIIDIAELEMEYMRLDGIPEAEIFDYMADSLAPESTFVAANDANPPAQKRAAFDAVSDGLGLSEVGQSGGFDSPGGKWIDLMAILGRPETRAQVEDAMRKWTARTGHEASAHIAADGTVLAAGTNSQPNEVMPPRLGFGDMSVTFTHTHPSATPLSVQDFEAMMRDPQPFRAILPEGQEVEARPLKALTFDELMQLNRSVFEAIYYDPDITAGLDQTSVKRVRQEAFAQVLEDLGVIQYTRPLDGLTEQEVEGVRKLFKRTEGARAALRSRIDERPRIEVTGSLWERPGSRRAEDEGEVDGEEAEDVIEDALGVLDDRSSARDKRPSFNPERVAQIADEIWDGIVNYKKGGQKPAHIEMYLSGQLTRDQVQAGVEAWLRNDGMKEMFTVIDVRRKMFPQAITEEMLEMYTDNRTGRAEKAGAKKVRVAQPYQKMISTAINMRALIDETGHGTFERVLNPFTAKDNLDGKTYFSNVGPELAQFVELLPPEGMRFDPPLDDPSNVKRLVRDRANNRLSEGGLEVAARTAKYFQANRYKIDKTRVYALRPDDLVSKKAMARKGMKGKQQYLDEWDAIKARNEGKDFKAWPKEDRDFWRNYGRSIDELRREAAKRVRQLQQAYEFFVRENGEDGDVGFMYQIDNRGRIYADGAFHPQADGDIKALFSHEGRNLVDDMVTVDASASGWQINALMARDEIAAPFLNMGRGQASQEGYEKSDLYTNTLEGIRQRLIEDAGRNPAAGRTLADKNRLKKTARTAQAILDAVFPSADPDTWRIDRDGLKPAVIAMNYGGQKTTMTRTLVRALYKDLNTALPKDGLDQQWSYLSDLAMDSLRETAPHAMDLQKWSIDSVKSLVEALNRKYPENPPKLEFTINIDGKVQVAKPKRIETEYRYTHSRGELLVRFKVDKPEQDPLRIARAVWANMVQSYDAAVLHRAVERYKKATDGAYITTNHDSFTVPPEHEGAIASAVRESMRTIMADVNVPRKLYEEIMAQARRYGVENDIDVQPFESMGQYDMDDLMTSTPVFGEQTGRPKDFVPEYVDLPDDGAELRRGEDVEPPAIPGQPTPLYVNRPVLNAAAIADWARSQGIPVTVPPEEMHVTLAYSTEPVDVANAPPRTDPVGGSTMATIAKMGDAIVLELPADFASLSEEHQAYRDAGASYDFPQYRPHITLAYDMPRVTVGDGDAYTGAIELGPQDQRQLREDAPPDDGGDGRPRPAPRRAEDIDVAQYMTSLPKSQGLVSKIQEHMTDARVGQRGFWDVVEDNIFNAFAPIRRLETSNGREPLPPGAESAFKSAEMAVNDSGRQEMLLYYGAAKLGQYGEYTVKEDTLGLRDIFALASGEGEGRGQRLQDWMQWMVARRAQQLEAEGIKTPLTEADIQQALDKGRPEFEQAAAEWKKHNDANIDFLVDTGRIGRAQADAMKADDFYVPFYRSDERVDGTSPELVLDGYRPGTTQSGLLRRDPGIMKIKGGDRLRIDNLMQNMIRNSQAMIAAGMRNRAANMSFELMERAGMADVEPISAKKPDPNAVRMWKDGVESWVIPRGRDAYPMMMALAGLQPTTLHPFLQIGADIASIFRQGITLTPPFMIRNAIRGAVSSGILTTGANLTPTNNTISGLTGALKKSAATQAFKAMSGMGDYRFGNSDVGFGKDDILIEFGLSPKTIGSRFRSVMNAAEEVGSATELADRVAAMNTMIERGMRRDEAAYQALTIMNYARRGGASWLRSMLPLVPFMNARLQGYSRLMEGAVGKRGAAGRKQAMMQLALNGLVYTAVGAGFWLMNYEDEEKRAKYEAEPLFRRLNYHISYWGDKTLYLPKAFELGHVFTSLPELFADQMLTDLNDLGPGAWKIIADTLAFNFVPAAALPAIEMWTNKDTFRDQPIEGLRETSLRPADRTQNASEIAKFIGQRMGVSDLTKVSPAMIEHFLSGYGGIYYVMASTVIDMVGAELGLTPAQPGGAFGDMPVVSQTMQRAFGSFLKDTDMSSTRFIEEFYTAKDHITQIYRSATEAARAGDVEYARKILDEAPLTPAAYKLVNAAASRLSDVNTRLRLLRQDRSMSAAEKRRQMKPLIKIRNELTRQVTEAIRKIEDEQGASFSRAR